MGGVIAGCSAYISLGVRRHILIPFMSPCSFSARAMAPTHGRMTIAALLLLLPLLALPVEGRRFDRCGLVRELRRQGFPSNKMRDWVCLVEAESSRDTSKVGPRNKNGSFDYGLFQINSRYWCGISKKGGDCNIKCSDLTNDNITDDSKCAKKIFGRQGFRAWYGWRNKCDGKTLPDISKC